MPQDGKTANDQPLASGMNTPEMILIELDATQAAREEYEEALRKSWDEVTKRGAKDRGQRINEESDLVLKANDRIRKLLKSIVNFPGEKELLAFGIECCKKNHERRNVIIQVRRKVYDNVLSGKGVLISQYGDVLDWAETNERSRRFHNTILPIWERELALYEELERTFAALINKPRQSGPNAVDLPNFGEDPEPMEDDDVNELPLPDLPPVKEEEQDAALRNVDNDIHD